MDSERISPPLPAADSPDRSTAVIRLLYAYAAAALCDESAAYSTVSEAVISAAEKKASASSAEREAEALKTLIRLCSARSGETAPAWQEDSPLCPTGRLPFQSRSDLALMLSELPPELIESAAGLSGSELSGRCGKAIRQLRFLQHGQAPDVSALKQALHGTPSLRTRADELSRDIQDKLSKRQSSPEEQAAGSRIHQITRSTANPENGKYKTVRVPLWAMICGAVLVCGMAVALTVLAVRKPQQPAPPETSDSDTDMPAPKYIKDVSEQRAPALAEAQETVLKEAGLEPESVIFLNTKLTDGSSTARYTVIFLDENGKQYEYLTENGKAVLQHTEQTSNLDDRPNTAGWRSLAELRQLALSCANLQTAVFTKEKLSTDGDVYYYKIEFTEDGSRNYSVYLNARTGGLMRYAVKDADVPDDGSLISLSDAKAKALLRAGDLKPDQVLFTKEKREGTVWVIGFTLDDGTQYTVELNARTGMANAVDVRPVSADTSQLIGTLKAKDAALEKAGLSAENSGVRFSKAKIDRSNAAYVYEFEFQTADYEYEATINAMTGEVLKYRVWMI
ncbi:MAG: PepSY domain-containing protein [Oscillospiraceae bacterium]|nr:PepSY domain-containing protein [Oscillospiraceae bacterium]